MIHSIVFLLFLREKNHFTMYSPQKESFEKKRSCAYVCYLEERETSKELRRGCSD